MGSSAAQPNRRRPRVRGVYCIEGDWWNRPIESSVRPVMEMLRQWDPFLVPFIRRDVATRAEFEHYLRQWTNRAFAKFPILYVALHGNHGVVSFGDGRRTENLVRIEEVAEMLQGKCSGRILHFGSCDTVHVHGNTLNSILKRTGAVAVSGYGDRLNWLEASALDALWFGALQGRAMTVAGVRAAEAELRRSSSSLIRFGNMKIHVRRASSR